MTRFNNKWFIVLWPVLFIVASVAGSLWLIFFGGLEFVQTQLTVLNDHVQGAANKPLWLVMYAVLCLISQLLVIPSGSLMLIAAGFIFSPLLAAAIFSVAQVLCSWPVYKLGEVANSRFPNRFKLFSERFKFPQDWQHVVNQEGYLSTVVLRLTPVIPSAAACLIAATLGIGLRKFIPATIAVCWIRPLFFASVGGSLQALTGLADAAAGLTTFKPLLLLFVASVLLLLVKIVLRLKQNPY